MQLRRSAPIAALALALLLPIAHAGPASPASPDPSKQQRIARLQEQLGEASQAEVSASAELQSIQGRRATLDASVAVLDARIRDVQARATAKQREATLLTAAALELDRRADRTSRQLVAAKQTFDDTAAALYSGNTEPSVAYTTLVLAASSVTEVGSGRVYLERVSAARQLAVNALAGLRTRNVQLRKAAEHGRARVEAARRAAVQEQQTLRGLRAQQATQRNAVAQHEARARTVVAKIHSQKSQYGAELASLQATSTQISALLYDLQSGQPYSSHFHVARPVPGYITSGFGWRYHPVLGYSRMHTGIDFHAGYGAPIQAAAPGRVVWAGPRGGYGNCVVIDHGNRYATLYGHASVLYVNVGDHVDTGATIAAVGATGLATGPHLHFEVRILGTPVDPAQYL